MSYLPRHRLSAVTWATWLHEPQTGGMILDSGSSKPGGGMGGSNGAA